MNKYEMINNALRYLNSIYPNQYFDLENKYSNEKVELACFNFGFKKLPFDYVWMLKEYGYLFLNGMSIYGEQPNFLNFEKLTIDALTIPNYGLVNKFHHIKNNYIVLNHEELDDCIDLVLDIDSDNVYYWDYYNDIYRLYDNVSGSNFIDVLSALIYAEYDSEGLLEKFPEELY